MSLFVVDKGVESVDISLENQSVKVKTFLSADEILEHIKKTGKDTQYVKSIWNGGQWWGTAAQNVLLIYTYSFILLFYSFTKVL